ncbi:uroporphyrinogen-III synthase [Exiguobacterium flavidum]|uniref:uroporphyrinogen-III synthase n=1 Tax=Exiguobacterium flavidum TaxID=2184695 RepID=UPI000DF80E34|nr:uroporphyrinogen-III synthase [Exiguobacterium flavidum]
MKRKQLWLTGSRDATETQRKRLQEAGIDCIHQPLIAVREVPFELPERIDWLIVTSIPGVERIAPLLGRLRDVKIAVVGTKTAKRLAHHGRQADFIPSAFTGDDLTRELAPELAPGARVCLARGNLARKGPLDALRAAGAVVEDVVTYETISLPVREELLASDYIALLSPSAVRVLAPYARETNAVYAAIGPVTVEAATVLGLTTICHSTEYTLDGLIERVIQEENS